MEPIRSPRNPRVASASRLRRARERRRTGRTLLEGPALLEEAVAAAIPIETVFVHEDDASGFALLAGVSADVVPVTRDVLARLAPTEHPRGPVAVVAIPPNRPPAGDVVWLEVRDPGNAGTLIRTAGAFDFDVALPAGAVDVWSPKVLRAGAGGHFRTSVTTGADPEAIPGRRIATVPGGGQPVAVLRELDAGPWVLLIGEEASGLDRVAVQNADVVVSIPMPGGVESLNAAVAGGIAMYELSSRPNAGRPSIRPD